MEQTYLDGINVVLLYQVLTLKALPINENTLSLIF